MTSKLPLLIACAAALGIAGTALAGDAGNSNPRDNPPAFKDLDKNADGAISPDEARDTWLAMAFDEVDVNHDGQISEVEYEEAES